MPVMKCPHPDDARTAVAGTDGKVSCGECGRVFTPKSARTRHGTYRGYGKHRYQHSGRWPWPPLPECGCQQAATAYRRGISARPVNVELRKQRGIARQRAHTRVKRAYPMAFAQFYREEMEAIGGAAPDVDAHVPAFDDVIARLVKEAIGIDEGSLVDKVKGRMATPREREVLRYVTRLRVLFSRAQDRGAAE